MDTRKTKGKVIDPKDFTPDTIQGILPKDFALELVRRYKEVIAPRFDPGMKVMMFIQGDMAMSPWMCLQSSSG